MNEYAERVVGVIPARYKSTRFPGKPLADICGKPMIWWVYQQCLKASLLSEVYVATDDESIADACRKAGMNYVMTSESCLTGTDRVAEAALSIEADIYVNIQGDEPMLEPGTIDAAIGPMLEDKSLLVTNLMTEIGDPVDVVNPTVPKVVTNAEGLGIYLTRATAPYPKGMIGYRYFKQVCVYGIRPEALRFFGRHGNERGKAKVEAIEDIEILRFIENGYAVHYFEVETASVAVDTQKDLEKVRKAMAERH